MDKIAEKFRIKKQEDWREVSTKDMKDLRGFGLTNKYKDIIFFVLIKIYPEIKWDVFSCRKIIPHHFWNSIENQRKFLDKITEKYNLKIQSDWVKINLNELPEFS